MTLAKHLFSVHVLTRHPATAEEWTAAIGKLYNSITSHHRIREGNHIGDLATKG